MAILVTGIAGFIGSHVARRLLERGETVVGVDNFNAYYNPDLKEARIKQLLGQWQPVIYRIDIADQRALEAVFSNHQFDAICHLAAQAGVRYSLDHPDTYIQSNINGTHNLFEAARHHGVTKFIFASSSSVYGGNTKLPFHEDDPVDRPLNLYAATKKANELEAYAYHHLFGINCFGLRFFTVYGPWGRPDMVLYTFIRALLAGKPINVYNHGHHRRDFTYIDDIVAGVVMAIDRCAGYEIINLGNSQPIELEYLISVIERALGVTATKNYLPLQATDLIDTVADTAKAQRLLDFKPLTTIETGVTQFIDWYRQSGSTF